MFRQEPKELKQVSSCKELTVHQFIIHIFPLMLLLFCLEMLSFEDIICRDVYLSLNIMALDVFLYIFWVELSL